MPMIHPIQPILVVALSAVLWYLKRKPAEEPPRLGGRGTPRATTKKTAKAKEQPELIHQQLRQQALQTRPEALRLPTPPGDDEVYGMLMEMEIAGAVVTLVCFANGDASVHYQSGGGMTGVADAEVRQAARQLIALGQRALFRLARTSLYPLPTPGKIRFYALTPRGILTAETDRESIGQPGDPLSALFYAGQEVVSQMREAEARQTAE